MGHINIIRQELLRETGIDREVRQVHEVDREVRPGHEVHLAADHEVDQVRGQEAALEPGADHRGIKRKEEEVKKDPEHQRRRNQKNGKTCLQFKDSYRLIFA